MKKTLLLIHAIAGALLLASLALAQAPTKTESNQTRQVKRQVLTSTYLPVVRLRFERRYKYVGSQEFILYDRARVGQYFFVNAWCDCVPCVETPRTAAPFSAIGAMLSRREHACFVHPGVSSRG